MPVGPPRQSGQPRCLTGPDSPGGLEERRHVVWASGLVDVEIRGGVEWLEAAFELLPGSVADVPARQELFVQPGVGSSEIQ